MKSLPNFRHVHGFDWDEGNIGKNFFKHGVSDSECEQVFFNNSLSIYHDEKHSEIEERYYALGRTDVGRMLFAVFTLRGEKVRIISVRDMNRKEREIYISRM